MLTLEFARRRRGLSQADLARRAHVTQSHLSLLEAGRRRPSTRVLRALACALAWRNDPLGLLSQTGGRKKWILAVRPEAKGGKRHEG